MDTYKDYCILKEKIKELKIFDIAESKSDIFTIKVKPEIARLLSESDIDNRCNKLWYYLSSYYNAYHLEDKLAKVSLQIESLRKEAKTKTTYYSIISHLKNYYEH